MLGFIAPYSHIVYNNNDSEGIFGFTWMSSFLFAVGFPFFLVTQGFLLFYVSKFLPRNIVKLFQSFAFLTAFTGFFFLTWSLNPLIEEDYHPFVYYGAMILISGILALSLKYYRSTIRYLMNERYSFVEFLIDIKNNDYKKMLKHALKPNLLNKADDKVFKDIKKDSRDFDDKIYEKAKELVE